MEEEEDDMLQTKSAPSLDGSDPALYSKLGVLASASWLQGLIVLAWVSLDDNAPAIPELWLVLYLVTVVATATVLGVARSATYTYHFKLSHWYLDFALVQLMLFSLLLYHQSWIVSQTTSTERRSMWWSLNLPNPTYEDRQQRLNLDGLLISSVLLVSQLVATVLWA